LAKKLSGLSFAELEEFSLDVQRRYVLGLPDSDKNVSMITQKCIKAWANRYKVGGDD